MMGSAWPQSLIVLLNKITTHLTQQTTGVMWSHWAMVHGGLT